MSRPLPVKVLVWVLALPAAALLFGGLALAPTLMPLLREATPYLGLALAAACALPAVTLTGWWYGARWAWWTLLGFAGLATLGAIAAVFEDMWFAFPVVALVVGGFALLLAPAARAWKGRGKGGWPTLASAWAAALVAGWTLATLPLSSLYTDEDGATLRADASAGLVLGAALLALGAWLVWRDRELRGGWPLATLATGGAGGAALALLLVIHADALATATLHTGFVEGQEAVFLGVGGALVAAFAVSAVLTKRAYGPGEAVRRIGAAMALAFGAGTLLASVWILQNARELQALADARARSPFPAALAFAAVALAALLMRGRLRRRND